MRKTKGAHLWALCGGWAIRPFQHRGSAPFVTRPAVGTYGTIECFLTPITHHRRSYGSTHSTKGALLHPQRKSSVLIDIEDKTYMRFHTAQHYN